MRRFKRNVESLKVVQEYFQSLNGHRLSMITTTISVTIVAHYMVKLVENH